MRSLPCLANTLVISSINSLLMDNRMKNYTQMPWFKELVSKLNGIASEVGLDDLSVEKLKEFMLQVALTQYKAGNNSGIRWMKEKNGQAPAAL